jgi:DNA repair exonuclease SbcCD ATPase subunit
MTTHAEFLNVKQMAEAVLGEAQKESTIRLWAQNFGIDPIDIGKERLFDPRLVPVFVQIQALKAEKRKREDIQANVNEALRALGMPVKAKEPEPGAVSGEVLTLLQTFGQQLLQQGEALQAATLAKVEHGLREHSDLADRLEAAVAEKERLGLLLEAVQHNLAQAEQQVKLLPAAEAERAELEAKAEGLADQLAEAERRRADAEAKAQTEADEAERMRQAAAAAEQANAEAARARAEAEAKARTHEDELDRMRRELDAAKQARAKAEGQAEERERQLKLEQQAKADAEAKLEAERKKSVWEKLFGSKKQ